MFCALKHLSLLAILTFVLSACGSAPVAQAPSAVPAATTAPVLAPAAGSESGAITASDDLGRSVTLEAIPQRIVSLAPSVTEILFAVGAGSQVVGNTTYCSYPPAATELPEVGGFSVSSFSLEAIVGLEPDLVIAGSADQQSLVEQLEALGIATFVLDPVGFNAVYDSIERVGTLTGHAAEAEQVLASMRARVDAVTAKVAAIPAADRPTVFWEISDDPLTSSGPNTFIGQVITMLGASNIFADAADDYPQVSLEVVLARDPQVILGPTSHGEQLVLDLIRRRPGWSDMQAVRDERIYLLDGDIVSRPGPRLVDALESLAAVLYPEIFE
ncbi:MAG: cobalamin-binding protein [Oscillochloris sp.]|nr:cobalamin-binding protein [Oscillochloris sp.]